MATIILGHFNLHNFLLLFIWYSVITTNHKSNFNIIVSVNMHSKAWWVSSCKCQESNCTPVGILHCLEYMPVIYILISWCHLCSSSFLFFTAVYICNKKHFNLKPLNLIVSFTLQEFEQLQFQRAVCVVRGAAESNTLFGCYKKYFICNIYTVYILIVVFTVRDGYKQATFISAMLSYSNQK